MILLFAVAFTYACNWRAIGHWRMIVAIIAAVVSVSGIMVSGSRTAWSTFLVFIVVTFFNRRLALPAMVFVGGVAAIFLATAPDALTDRGREMFEYRLSSKLERVQGDEVLDHFQAVDAGRYKIWMSAITTFIEKPWVIPCGVGFIGYNRLDTRGSAHNIFLTLIGELGVIGLFLYLMWFRELWRRGNDLLIKQRLRTGVRTHFFCPTGVKPLLACLSFSLLGGEILYVYRPSFAFLGMFLFICAVMTHPTLVSASSALRQSAPPKVSAYRRAGHGAKRCDTVRGIKQANWPRRLFEIRKNYAITSKPFHKA
ncbi:MAG TPA: O-antigen ligase family protein [Clostridia bacterium]|nr:O-antigen ligase family protein [Clostridia bacterium]